MVITRILAVSIAWTVMATTPASSAIDLSKYRVFEFGSSLANVARQAGISAEPRVVHQRPEIIQELMWLPVSVAPSEGAGDSVRKVIFTFYNDQLSRIVVSVRSREDAGADFRRPRRSGFRDVRRVDASRSGDHVPGDAAGHTREVRRAVGGPAVLGHSFPVQLPVDVWPGAAVKATGWARQGCQRRSHPAGRPGSSGARGRAPADAYCGEPHEPGCRTANQQSHIQALRKRTFLSLPCGSFVAGPRCALLHSQRHVRRLDSTHIPSTSGCFVARDEQLAYRVGELEQTVRELVEQNIELRRAASDFGALAERLNAQLSAERRASSNSSRPRFWVTLDRFAGEIARFRLRT